MGATGGHSAQHTYNTHTRTNKKYQSLYIINCCRTGSRSRRIYRHSNSSIGKKAFCAYVRCILRNIFQRCRNCWVGHVAFVSARGKNMIPRNQKRRARQTFKIEASTTMRSIVKESNRFRLRKGPVKLINISSLWSKFNKLEFSGPKRRALWFSLPVNLLKCSISSFSLRTLLIYSEPCTFTSQVNSPSSFASNFQAAPQNNIPLSSKAQHFCRQIPMRSSSHKTYTCAHLPSTKQPQGVLPSARPTQRREIFRCRHRNASQGWAICIPYKVLIICAKRLLPKLASYNPFPVLCMRASGKKWEAKLKCISLARLHNKTRTQDILNNETRVKGLKETVYTHPRPPPTRPLNPPPAVNTHVPHYIKRIWARCSALQTLKCPWPKRNPIMLGEWRRTVRLSLAPSYAQ